MSPARLDERILRKRPSAGKKEWRIVMQKNAESKKLGLRVETLRNLDSREMSQIQGGFINLACTTVFVPSSGITYTYAIVTTACN